MNNSQMLTVIMLPASTPVISIEFLSSVRRHNAVCVTGSVRII